MEHSQTLVNLAKALVDFQGDLEHLKKDSTNPFFKNKYLSLDGVIEGTSDLLKKHGLAVIQLPGVNGLTTMLLHESGEFIKDTSPIVVAKGNDPQAFGAGITYLRRYSLKGLLKVSEEDDDGNLAANKGGQNGNTTATSTNKEKPGINSSGVRPIAPSLEKPSPSFGSPVPRLAVSVSGVVASSNASLDHGNPTPDSVAKPSSDAPKDRERPAVSGQETSSHAVQTNLVTSFDPDGSFRVVSSDGALHVIRDLNMFEIPVGVKKGTTLRTLKEPDLIKLVDFGVKRIGNYKGEERAKVEVLLEVCKQLLARMKNFRENYATMNEQDIPF